MPALCPHPTCPPLTDTAALDYLSTFAVSLPLVASPLLLTGLATQHIFHLAPPVTRDQLASALMPGLCSGCLWAVANVLSVQATMHLGQAIAFPLTQLCIIVCALWGILYFQEMHMQGMRLMMLFCCSCIIVLLGAFGLSYAK